MAHRLTSWPAERSFFSSSGRLALDDDHPYLLSLKHFDQLWIGTIVRNDGVQIGGTQTATALHSSGQTQTFDVLGTFAAGNHVATIDFLNDAYGGSSTTDRNLYVTGASIDGTTIAGATLNEGGQGPQSFNFVAPGSTG